jgi:leucyl-tRNA synthetase
MDLTNQIYAKEPLEQDTRPEVRKELLEMLTLMLAPMVPHVAEEFWEKLGHADGLWNAKWPYLGVERAELARPDEVEIPVQVNGKVRGRVTVPMGAKEDDVVRLAKALPAVAQHMNGKRIVKTIFVPDKLLNLVVAG